MDAESRTIALSDANYKWLSETFGYGASSAFGAASNLLTLYRNHLSAGGDIDIRPETENLKVDSAIDFDLWVYKNFPFLEGASEYPREDFFGDLPELASDRVSNKSNESGFPEEPSSYTTSITSQDVESRCSVNAVLQTLSLLNLGTNHEANYRLIGLEKTGSLQTDLEHHFCSLVDDCDSDWFVKAERCDGDWEVLIAKSAQNWFFGQEFSPKVDSEKSRAIVDAFLCQLRSRTRASFCFRLNVRPPLFYESFWEDFVLEGSDRRWLLHFGFSD